MDDQVAADLEAEIFSDWVGAPPDSANFLGLLLVTAVSSFCRR
ncbi:MAG: hypothetical protein ACJAY5_001396 [Actinomycetes bacterium]|jgi:hypothetical protein